MNDDTAINVKWLEDGYVYGIPALIATFQKAKNIRLEGHCPNCKTMGLMSFQFEEDVTVNRGENQEQCGYYCYLCKWSNAGTREIE